MSVVTTFPAAEPGVGESKEATIARHARGGRRGLEAAWHDTTWPGAHVCENCGRHAVVHILEHYDHGQPVVRHLCLDCDDSPLPARDEPIGGLRPGLPVLVCASGLALLVVGLFGDVLLPDRHAGFGSRQQTAVILALLLGVVGMLLRIGPLALSGLLLLAASISADWFGLVSGPGVGFKQQSLAGIGAGLAVIGFLSWVRGRQRRKHRPASSDRVTSPCAPARAVFE